MTISPRPAPESPSHWVSPVPASFPTPRYLDGGRPALWIEVGASSWEGGVDLAASFSNYGRETVDLFAPGVEIMSTIPGGGYEANDGTSMQNVGRSVSTYSSHRPASNFGW